MELGSFGGDVKTWTTKSNQKIPIEEMTDSHLGNTLRQIERKAAERTEAFRSMDRGEYWNEYWKHHEVWPEELNPEYTEMMLEERRRGL